MQNVLCYSLFKQFCTLHLFGLKIKAPGSHFSSRIVSTHNFISLHSQQTNLPRNVSISLVPETFCQKSRTKFIAYLEIRLCKIPRKKESKLRSILPSQKEANMPLKAYENTKQSQFKWWEIKQHLPSPSPPLLGKNHNFSPSPWQMCWSMSSWACFCVDDIMQNKSFFFIFFPAKQKS